MEALEAGGEAGRRSPGGEAAAAGKASACRRWPAAERDLKMGGQKRRPGQGECIIAQQ